MDHTSKVCRMLLENKKRLFLGANWPVKWHSYIVDRSIQDGNNALSCASFVVYHDDCFLHDFQKVK